MATRKNSVKSRAKNARKPVRKGRTTRKPRKQMSAEGRANIAAAARKRWRRYRAENKAAGK